MENQPEDPGGIWVEGEWIPNPAGPSGSTSGPLFDGCLFLPTGSEDSGGATVVVLGGRQVINPTLLYSGKDRNGLPVFLDREDRVGIVAPELNAWHFNLPPDGEVAWLVDGSPQPFGRPGDVPVGFLANLERVED